MSNQNPPPQLYKISQVADLLKLTTRTIRYYEQIGLLPTTRRTLGKMRLFNDRDIAIIRKIRDLQGDSKMSLDEIKQVITVDQSEIDQLKARRRIRIVTDSSAVLTAGFAKQHDIRIIPQETESQKGLIDWLIAMSKDGIEKALVILTSSELSEMYATAQKIASKTKLIELQIIDSHTCAAGLGILIEYATTLLTQNQSLDNIQKEITKCITRQQQFFALPVPASTITSGLLPYVLDNQLKTLLDFIPIYQITATGVFEHVHNFASSTGIAESLVKQTGLFCKSKGITPAQIYIQHFDMILEAEQVKRLLLSMFPAVTSGILTNSSFCKAYLGKKSLGIALEWAS